MDQEFVPNLDPAASFEDSRQDADPDPSLVKIEKKHHCLSGIWNEQFMIRIRVKGSGSFRIWIHSTGSKCGFSMNHCPRNGPHGELLLKARTHSRNGRSMGSSCEVFRDIVIL